MAAYLNPARLTYAKPNRVSIEFQPDIGAGVRVSYRADDAPATNSIVGQSVVAPAYKMQLAIPPGNKIAQSGVSFNWLGKFFYSEGNLLLRDYNSETDQGVVAGVIDLTTGIVTITSAGAFAEGQTLARPVLKTLVTEANSKQAYATKFAFRVLSAPVKPTSFIVSGTFADGGTFTATADGTGLISDTFVKGTIDYTNGVVELAFGEEVDDNAGGVHTTDGYYQVEARRDKDTGPGTDFAYWSPKFVNPDSVNYNVVTLSSVPIDPSLLGLDPVRLPVDGRVPIFKTGYVVVIHNTQNETLPNGLVSSQAVPLPRGNIAYVILRDQNDARVPTDRYTVDLTTGIITMAAALDLTGFTEPLIAEHRQEDMAVVTGASIDGTLTLNKPLGHSYTAGDSYVSSALIYGDLQARVTNLFDQVTWTGVFDDNVIGTNAPATYNDIAFPLTVVNEACVTQRWALVFTSSTAFDIIAEELGVVGTGDIASTTAPLDPLTGLPYFSMAVGGWGVGWSAGNVVRFNTIGASGPTWLVRTTRPGDDSFPLFDQVKVQIRGDAE